MSSPPSFVQYLRAHYNAITSNPQFIKKFAMAQLTANPPQMGAAVAPKPNTLGTSSSSRYTSSSSMFDKITPASTTSFSEPAPPLTPVPSEGKSTFNVATQEDSPMPLIDLAPDESVDINEIRPEIMSLVGALIDCNADLDPAMLLNRFVKARKKRQAESDAEEEAEAIALARVVHDLRVLVHAETPKGKGKMAFNSPAYTGNSTADLSYLSDILSAYMDRDGDRSFEMSTPPAPHLKATELDDDSIPFLSLLDRSPAKPVIIPSSTSYRCVATPSSLLFSSNADENMTMPSFGAQARALDGNSDFPAAAGLTEQRNSVSFVAPFDVNGFVINEFGFKPDHLITRTPTPGETAGSLNPNSPPIRGDIHPSPIPANLSAPHPVSVPTITLTAPPPDAISWPVHPISGRTTEDASILQGRKSILQGRKSTFHSGIPYRSAKVIHPRGTHLGAERASHIRIHFREDPSTAVIPDGVLEEELQLQPSSALPAPITPAEPAAAATPTILGEDGENVGPEMGPKVEVAPVATSATPRELDAVMGVPEGPGRVQDRVEEASLRLVLGFAPSTPTRSTSRDVGKVGDRHSATPELPRLDMAYAETTPSKVGVGNGVPYAPFTPTSAVGIRNTEVPEGSDTPKLPRLEMGHAASTPSKPVSLRVVVPYTTSTPVGIKAVSQTPSSVQIPFRASASSIVISDVSVTLQKVAVIKAARQVARSPGEAFDVGDLTQKLNALLEANRLDSDYGESSADNSPAPSVTASFFTSSGSHLTLRDTTSLPRKTRVAKYIEERQRQIKRDRVGGAQLLFPEAHASSRSPVSADSSLVDDPFSLPASPNVSALVTPVAATPPLSTSKPKTRVFLAPKPATKRPKATVASSSSSSVEHKVQPVKSIVPRWNGSQQVSLSRNNSGSSATSSTGRRSPSTIPPRPVPKPGKFQRSQKPMRPQPQAQAAHSSHSGSGGCICAVRRATVPSKPTARPLRPVKKTLPLVPRKSSATSSKSTASTQALTGSTQALSAVGSAATTEDGGAPDGMDPAAWNEILAIVPRRSNQPNPNAPNIFNITPAGSDASIDVIAHAGSAHRREDDGSVHSTAFSSPWLSPEAYERRLASREESPLLSGFPLLDLVPSPGSVYSNMTEAGSAPPSPIVNISASRTSMDPSPIRPGSIPRSNNIPGHYSSSELGEEAGDEGLVTVPSSGSLGTLTPSHSVKNIAGIGKGLPSYVSQGSLARSSRESSVSSNISLSASQSLNPLPSVLQFRTRRLHTIQEESNSPPSSYFPLPSESRAATANHSPLKTGGVVSGVSFISEPPAVSSIPSPTSSPISERRRVDGGSQKDHSTGTDDPSLFASPNPGTKIISSIKSIVSRFKLPSSRDTIRAKKVKSGGSALSPPALVAHADVEQTLDLSGERAAAPVGSRSNGPLSRPLKRLF